MIGRENGEVSSTIGHSKCIPRHREHIKAYLTKEKSEARATKVLGVVTSVSVEFLGATTNKRHGETVILRKNFREETVGEMCTQTRGRRYTFRSVHSNCFIANATSTPQRACGAALRYYYMFRRDGRYVSCYNCDR